MKLRRKKPDPMRYAGMVSLPGGVFQMGSNDFYPEEAPARRVSVDPFWIDETPVTNAEFARFVAATGHMTLAERAPNSKDYPGMAPEMARAGSLVFVVPDEPVGLDDPTAWWRFSFGADWRHPTGPDSNLDQLMDHPVVHVAFEDALAYAKWAGKALPTEAEFEFAARGGLQAVDYAWGHSLAPKGAMLANYWQGRFPGENTVEDGWVRTSPVRSFPPNGYGLFDLIGNVWEWTNDWWALPERAMREKPPCCTLSNPRGGLRVESIDTKQSERFPRKVLKGGSYLCAENYCQRYRPAARHPETIDTSTGHVGFRCVLRS